MDGSHASTTANPLGLRSMSECAELCIDEIRIKGSNKFEFVQTNNECNALTDSFKEWIQAAAYNCQISSSSSEPRVQTGPKKESDGNYFMSFGCDCLFNLILGLLAFMLAIGIIFCDGGLVLS